jgi:hypothetical protein
VTEHSLETSAAEQLQTTSVWRDDARLIGLL